MEDSKLIVKENGVEKEYRVLFNMEDVEGKNYVVYTADEEMDNKDIITYAANYIIDENGDIKLTSIKDDKEWEFVKNVLNSLQNEGE